MLDSEQLDAYNNTYRCTITSKRFSLLLTFPLWLYIYIYIYMFCMIIRKRYHQKRLCFTINCRCLHTVDLLVECFKKYTFLALVIYPSMLTNIGTNYGEHDSSVQQIPNIVPPNKIISKSTLHSNASHIILLYVIFDT